MSRPGPYQSPYPRDSSECQDKNSSFHLLRRMDSSLQSCMQYTGTKGGQHNGLVRIVICNIPSSEFYIRKVQERYVESNKTSVDGFGCVDFMFKKQKPSSTKALFRKTYNIDTQFFVQQKVGTFLISMCTANIQTYSNPGARGRKGTDRHETSSLFVP